LATNILAKLTTVSVSKHSFITATVPNLQLPHIGKVDTVGLCILPVSRYRMWILGRKKSVL